MQLESMTLTLLIIGLNKSGEIIFNMNRLLSLILILSSQYAVATTCWMPFMEAELARQKGEEYDPFNAAVDNSSLVFVGTAISTMKKVFDTIDMESHTMEVITQFEVSQTIKGVTSNEVSIVSDRPPGTCRCIYDFEAGVEYLVLARKINNKYHTVHCNSIRPTEGSMYNEITDHQKVDQ